MEHIELLLLAIDELVDGGCVGARSMTVRALAPFHCVVLHCSIILETDALAIRDRVLLKGAVPESMSSYSEMTVASVRPSLSPACAAGLCSRSSTCDRACGLRAGTGNRQRASCTCIAEVSPRSPAASSFAVCVRILPLLASPLPLVLLPVCVSARCCVVPPAGAPLFSTFLPLFSAVLVCVRVAFARCACV